MAPTKHFLQFRDLSRAECDYLFERARTLKAKRSRGELYQPLHGKVLAMIFEKNSTRTRVSFQAGMEQMGGSAMFLTSADTQLGRGESIEDVAEVLCRMVDIVMIRTFAQSIIERFAAHSRVPVINGLTNEYHPCQVLADVFTYIEQRGSIQGKTVAWIGDSNNVCKTWLDAASLFDFKMQVASPPGYELQATDSASNKYFERFSNPHDAARNADLVVTDVWTSMGFEEEAEERKRKFADFQVDGDMMQLAHNDAIFMHCLPAHRGEEVAAEVIDGPQSVVWTEAENRLHTQKALMEYLLLGKVKTEK